MNIGRLKQFSVEKIEEHHLTLPVHIEVLDAGMNSFCELDALEKISDGTYTGWSGPRFTGSGALPRPWSVRFTGKGEAPFVKDAPHDL